MEQANLSSRIARIKYTHEFICTPMGRMHLLPKRIQVNSEQFSLSQLGIKPINTDGFVSDNTTELLVCWLRHNVGNFSQKVKDFWNECIKLSNKTAVTLINSKGAVMKQAYTEAMKFRKTGLDGFAGSTLYLRERPSYEVFILAWRLATMTHPFCNLVLNTICKHHGTNAIDFLTPDKLLASIDFPCTSIANMLIALDIPYVRDLEYIDKGWIVTPLTELMTIYYNANWNCYRTGSSESIRMLLNNELVEHPLTRDEAFQLGITDFDNGEK